MADLTQHKIGRIRPPRVQITYDVEVGDAVEVKELPFIVGVMADLAGHAQQKKLKERKFVQIDNETFNDVLKSTSPELNIVVPNKLDEKGGNIPVELKFSKLSDFDPMSIVHSVDKMRATYEQRNALNALLAKIYVNDDLAAALNEVVRSSASDEDLKKNLAELVNKI